MTIEHLIGILESIASSAESLAEAERRMNEAGIDSFGINSVNCAGRVCRYINRGDTYATTIIDDSSGPEVASWGGWYEEAEREHCEEDSVIRCGYCGELTPLEEGAEWRECRCERCGRNVADGTPMPEPARDDD